MKLKNLKSNVKNYFKKIDKGILTLIIIFLILTPVVLTPWVQGNDRVGYYAYVRSAFIDHDLDFKNEREHHNQTVHIESIRQDPNTGEYFSQYPIGTALLWSPYFLIGHIIALLTSYETDGYSLPYVYMVCLGSAIYAFIGIILLYLILKKYFRKSIALLSVITIWFASNLFYYMYFESSMSHANSFLQFLYFFISGKKTSEREQQRNGFF